jgi:hypothetical protein
LNQDHDKLIKDIDKRKVWKESKYGSHEYNQIAKNQRTQKQNLTKQAKDLKFVLNSLNDYIGVSLKDWASNNSVEKAFFTREFASGKK